MDALLPINLHARAYARAVAVALSDQDYKGGNQQNQRPEYRLYEVQNGNHIETYKDTFAQLELIQPQAQNAFDLLVKSVEQGSPASAGSVHSAGRRDRNNPRRAWALRQSLRTMNPGRRCCGGIPQIRTRAGFPQTLGRNLGTTAGLTNPLVERPGEVVGKDELMTRVWPGTFVEEGNLKFQVSALRRTLGDGNRYLANIPGRGYSFVAPVAVADGPPQSPPPPAAAQQAHNLPAALIRMIGRADAVSTLAARLPRQRLLTIVGPGGIGKTSVALAVAEALLAAYEHGVWLIDLAPLADSRLVPSALASVLGLEVSSDNSLPGLIVFLRDRQMLLVLDNCEHVVEAAAALAVAVLRGTAGVHILATSRERLRVEGERVYCLSPREPACIRPAHRRRGARLPGRSAVRRAGCREYGGRFPAQRRGRPDRR